MLVRKAHIHGGRAAVGLRGAATVARVLSRRRRAVTVTGGGTTLATGLGLLGVTEASGVEVDFVGWEDIVYRRARATGIAGGVRLVGAMEGLTTGDSLLELGGVEIGQGWTLAGRGSCRSRMGRVARWRVGLLRWLLGVWLDGHLHCHVGYVALRCLQQWLLLLLFTLLGRIDNLRVLGIVVVVGIGGGGGVCRG